MESTYTISHSHFGKFTEYRLINNKTGSYVTVIPEFGATLNQIGLFANQKVHDILLGSTTYEQLITEGTKVYKGSKLLPFPNRINKGNYEFNGKNYHLDVNETDRQCSLHGLVVDKPFTVESTQTDESSAKLTVAYDYQGTIEGYPFKYAVKVIYQLNEKGFSCTTILTNIDNQELPIGDGVHPYFKTGSIIDNWLFKLPKCEILDVDDRLIPTMKIGLFEKYEELKPFGDQTFDTCFALNVVSHPDHIATVEIHDKEKGIKLAIWQEVGAKKYNYIQIYTSGDRKSMAIEPMTCAPDSFNNKLGLIILKPKETIELTWGASLSDLSQ